MDPETREIIARQRTTAVEVGNLIVAAFAASQQPGKDSLTETELRHIKDELTEKDATAKIRLLPLYFLPDKEKAWIALRKELTAYLDSCQYYNALEALRLLKTLSKTVSASDVRYRHIIKELPKKYFDGRNHRFSDFEEFWVKEIAELYPCHQERLKYYAELFFYFIEQDAFHEQFLNTMVSALRNYQPGSIIDLKHQLTELADGLGVKLK